MKKLLLLFLSAIFLSACSHQATTSTSSTVATPTTATITAQNFSFSGTLTVEPGATITFVNKDIASHSVTAKDKSFDTGLIGKDQTVTFTAPTTKGTYTYFCTAHPNMTGTIVVQ